MSLKFFNALASAFALGGILAYAGYGLAELLLIADSLIIVWAVTHYALDKIAMARGNNHGVMTVGLIMLFWIAYTLKLPIAVLFPDAFWVVPDLVTAEGLRKQIPFAYAVAALGYTILLLSVVWAPKRRPIEWQMDQFRPKVLSLLILSVFALILKYALKDVYSLGVPTVDPVDLGVPFLTGFITMVIEIGFFILVNTALFATLYTTKPWLISLGLIVAFANCTIELMFGSKEFLMYQIVITFAYIFIFHNYGPVDRIRRIRLNSRYLIVIGSALTVFTIVFYKFFNLFRYARLTEDRDTFSALNFITADRAIDFASSILMLWNRMNGIELLSAVIAVRERFGHFSLLEIFSGTITDRFTYIILGTTEANTRFGLTAFGHFYVSGGMLGVILGTIMLGFFFVFLQNCILRIHVNNHARIAVLPILWILIVRVLFGGGNLVLVAKEFFVFLLMFWLFAKMFYLTGQNRSLKRAPGDQVASSTAPAE